MQVANHDTTTDSPYNGNRNEQSPAHTTGRRTRTTKQRPTTGCKPVITGVEISRIDTVPMTAAEYDNAVEALAVLITNYQQQHDD